MSDAGKSLKEWMKEKDLEIQDVKISLPWADRDITVGDLNIDWEPYASGARNIFKPKMTIQDMADFIDDRLERIRKEALKANTSKDAIYKDTNLIATAVSLIEYMQYNTGRAIGQKDQYDTNAENIRVVKSLDDIK